MAIQYNLTCSKGHLWFAPTNTIESQVLKHQDGSPVTTESPQCWVGEQCDRDNCKERLQLIES